MKKGQEILDLIKDVNNEIDKGLKGYFAKHGITVTQLAVVNILRERGQVKQVELSKELKITPSAVSMILNRLEAQKVLERQRDNKDKRIVYVRLTDWFRESHKNLGDSAGNYLDILLKSRNAQEIETVLKGLNILRDILAEGTTVEVSSKCPHLQGEKE